MTRLARPGYWVGAITEPSNGGRRRRSGGLTELPSPVCSLGRLLECSGDRLRFQRENSPASAHGKLAQDCDRSGREWHRPVISVLGVQEAGYPGVIIDVSLPQCEQLSTSHSRL